MITREEVRFMVSDVTQKYDSSCYPMQWEVFLDLMTSYLFALARRNNIEIEDFDTEMFQNAEDVVCTNFKSDGITDPDIYA